jgi:excisionase family DNA binding protein
MAWEVEMIRQRLTVTVAEAGELLGISRAHAYELVRRGELPNLRLGRRIVVPLRPLRAMVDGDVLHDVDEARPAAP